MHEEGLRVDTATGGELAVALRAGVPGADIGLHGNNKSDAEIARALAAGVGRIIVDSLVEIERVADAAAAAERRAPVMVRVTTGVHAGGHEYISTAHEDQKFGLSIACGRRGQPGDAAAARRAGAARAAAARHPLPHRLADPRPVRVRGRRPRGADPARAAARSAPGCWSRRSTSAAATASRTCRGRSPLDPDRIAKDVAASVPATATDWAPRCRGSPSSPAARSSAPPASRSTRSARSSPCGSTTGRVRTYVSIDGGMSDNIRPALYGASYTRRSSAGCRPPPTVLARVVGKHCESGDIVVHEVQLPADVRAGRPARRRGDRCVRAVDGVQLQPRARARRWSPSRDGASRVLVRRETEDDLLALDLG